MAAGFGYQNYKQQAMPQMVGGMLGQQGMPPVAPDQPPGPSDLPEPGDMPDPGMGAPADGLGEQDWPTATKAALKEAIERAMSTAPAGQNPRLPNPRHKLQLIQLGLPEQEADLLQATRGSNT